MNDPILDVSITYCAAWHYTDRAVSLTAEILNERDLEQHVASWRLIPSSGGLYEVVVNGELIFPKKAIGRHAEPGEVQALFRTFLIELRTGHTPPD